MKRLLFLLFTAALAALFLIALGQDMTREWTAYQRRFIGSLEKGERKLVSGGIKQLQATDLKRVDRCTTCHIAIERPQLALAEEPFTAHPGQYLTWHPPEKFGCTVCHGGQGLATEVKAAHGEVRHWDRPLLSGPYVQSSCLKCHGDIESIKDHVPQLTEGIALYKELGCAGCHAVNGFGQTVSVDLSDIGDKPLQLLDFTFVGDGHGGREARHELRQWVYEHFLEPRKITPGFRSDELPPGEEEVYPTFMPNYGLNQDQAHALTIYMLGLTAEQLPAKYVVPDTTPDPEPVYSSAVERGRAVFKKYGCVGCHGVEGQGGRKNFNAALGQETPPLVHVSNYYANDRAGLKQLIELGRQPVPRAEGTRPRPPAFMPAWKGRIPDEEIDALIEYLMTLSGQLTTDLAGQAASAPPAAQGAPAPPPAPATVELPAAPTTPSPAAPSESTPSPEPVAP